MVVDTSALFAILASEPERRLFEEIIDTHDAVVCSSVSYAELGIVAARRFGKDMRTQVQALVERLGIELVAVDPDMAMDAISAHLSFGKGVHSARLNICDCFAYALARSRNDSLLFKSDDFARTDILPAWRP
jgi:ribonuclease VapC